MWLRFSTWCMVLSVLSLVSACGFTPVHQRDTNTESQYSEIDIGIIPNREGVYLRNQLIDRMHFGGTPVNPRYRLVINPIKERQTDLDITRASDVTRVQLQQSTTLRMIDTQTDEIVLSRNVVAVTSTNVLASEFANRVSLTDARMNGLGQLADMIERHIALYFKSQSR